MADQIATVTAKQDGLKALLETEQDVRGIFESILREKTLYDSYCINKLGGYFDEAVSELKKNREPDYKSKCHELLQTMRKIAFATAPEPDDGSWHENAYSLAMDAIEKFEAQNFNN